MDDKNNRHGSDKKNGSGNGRWRAFKSLDAEIGEIERQMRGHRASSTLHAAAVERSLREKASSPVALLVAAGAGFAAGHFGVFRKNRHHEVAGERDTHDDESGRHERRGFNGASLMNQIMQGLSLAGTIMSLLPKRRPPADIRDVFLSPYFGWVVERLRQAIRPDTSKGEAPEVPRYEANRDAGMTTEVNFWTAKEVREVRRCHLNYVVADTLRWEQSAAYTLDNHPALTAFVKNAGLEFAIPYFHNGQDHDYYPDFLIRLACERPCHLILETKGYDPLEDIKRAAAERWVAAVNAEGSYGFWMYRIVKDVSSIAGVLNAALAEASSARTRTPSPERSSQ